MNYDRPLVREGRLQVPQLESHPILAGHCEFLLNFIIEIPVRVVCAEFDHYWSHRHGSIWFAILVTTQIV